MDKGELGRVGDELNRVADHADGRCEREGRGEEDDVPQLYDHLEVVVKVLVRLELELRLDRLLAGLARLM